MADDLDSLSVEQLLALKNNAASPIPTADISTDYDSMSVDQLLALKSSSVNKPWNAFDAAKNFGSGVLEGATGFVGMGTDAVMQMANPIGYQNAKLQSLTPSQLLQIGTKPVTAEKDPQYRYSRTIGDFAAPVGGGSKLRQLLEGVIGGGGAQIAEDVTGDKTVAPLFGAVTATGATSAAGDILSLLKRVTVGATPQEIRGSAAKAFADQTGLSADDLRAVNTGPQDTLGALQTTAERTGNAGVAQIEKSLAGVGDNANIYANLDAQRNATRNQVVNAASDVTSVNKEGLGQDLITTAEDVQGRMQGNSQAFWDGVPRDEVIPVDRVQAQIGDLLGQRQAGLPLGSKVRSLIDQVRGAEFGVMTSGALQDIRSDVLTLARDANITPFETRILADMQESIDTAMSNGLTDRSYNTWQAARQSTAVEKQAFGRGTAGGYLTSDNARVSNVLDKVFKGDAQAVDELRTAVGQNPEIMERVKRGVLDMIPTSKGKYTPEGFNKFIAANETGLRNLMGDDHFSNFKRAGADLRSQANVKDLAFKASEGGSPTSQRETVARALQDAIIEGSVPGASGLIAKIGKVLKDGAGVNDTKAVEDLLFQASLNPSFAELLAQTPTTKRILTGLEWLSRSASNAKDAAIIAGTKEIARNQNSSNDSQTTSPLLSDSRGQQILNQSNAPQKQDSQGLAASFSGPQKFEAAKESQQILSQSKSILPSSDNNENPTSKLEQLWKRTTGGEKVKDFKLLKTILGGEDMRNKSDIEAEIDADPFFKMAYELESSRGKQLSNDKSSASGPFQMVNATAKALGVNAKDDNFEDDLVGLQKLKAEYVKAGFGDAPQTLYAMHFLGVPTFKSWANGEKLTKRQQKNVDEFQELVFPRVKRYLLRNNQVEA